MVTDSNNHDFSTVPKAGRLYSELGYNILFILPKGAEFPRFDGMVTLETADGKSAEGLGSWRESMNTKQEPNFIESYDDVLQGANSRLTQYKSKEEFEKVEIKSLNIAIVQGNVSSKFVYEEDTNGLIKRRKTGSCVIECDGEGEDVYLEAILTSPLRQKLLNQPQARTPSGGLHVYLRYFVDKYKKNEIELKSQDLYDGEGHNEIKLIGYGKYTIAPPTPGYVFEKFDFRNMSIFTMEEIQQIITSIKRTDRRKTKGELWTDVNTYQDLTTKGDLKSKLINIGKIIYEPAIKRNRRHDTGLAYSGILKRYIKLNKEDAHIIIDAIDPNDRKNYGCVEDTYGKKDNQITSIVAFRKLLIELMGEAKTEEILEDLMLFNVPERQFFYSDKPDGRLLGLAVDRTVECFFDQDKNAYALVHDSKTDSYQVINLDSTEFDQMLSRWYVDEMTGRELARQEHKKQTIVTLKSLINKKPVTLYDRCVWLTKENTVFYNLNNELGELVRVTADGFDVIKQNPNLMHFRKLPNTFRQVTPSQDFDANYDYLGELLGGIKNADHKMIFKVWEIALLFNRPPYPINHPIGPDGSGKTVTLKMAKSLIDPVEDFNAPTAVKRAELLATELEIDERKTDDVNLTIYKNYFTIFDNISKLTPKLRDILCRWVTGMKFSKRVLYTTLETVEVGGARPLALSGIVNSANNPDLLSRMFNPEFELDENNRKTEEELWTSFYENKAKVLGYMFNIVSKVLANYDELKKTIKPGNRLADFTVLGEVIARCLGYPEGEFIRAWDDVRDEQVSLGLDSSTTAIILQSYLLKEYTHIPMDFGEKTVHRIEQSATNWHKDLKKHGIELKLIQNDDADAFPRSPNTLATELYGLVRSFKHIGIKIEKGVKSHTGRTITVDYTDWNINKYQKPRPIDESSGIIYKCYYCKATPFRTRIKSDYETHQVRHHSGKPAYPNYAYIEKDGLVPQGKPWEGKMGKATDDLVTNKLTDSTRKDSFS